MNEQTRATAITAPPAPTAARSPAPEDAWDRLAALAFGDTASAGGCSVHAYDCACSGPEQPASDGDGAEWSEDDAYLEETD